MKPILLSLAICFAFLADSSVHLLSAQPSQNECTRINAVLDDAARTEATLACEGAMVAVRELARCGFHPQRPLRIGVVSVVYDGRGTPQLGDYLPDLDRIRLLSRAAFGRLAKPVFADVPISEADHYRSVAAHEVVHAIFHPYTKHLDLPVNAQEYVAYAVQIMTLPADVRQRLLSTERASPDSLFHFTPFLLLADPQRFAVQAFRHFRAPENGCVFLHAIISQRVHFPPGTE